MVNDLISRSALIERLEKHSSYDLGCFDEELDEIIKTQPTAYDVEKVVAELEKASNDVISNHFCYEDDDHTGIYNDGKSDGYDDAIDIVRKGGVE